jgi:hypothetical protein
MGTGSYAALVSRYGLMQYQEASVAGGQILPYILSNRIRTLLFLWMSSFTAAGVLFHLAYAWYLAASAGLLLSLFAIKAGYEGILWFACCIFPQWILYGCMWKEEASFLIRCRMRRGILEPAESVRFRFGPLWVLAKLLGLCTLGCAMEAWLGTWTLKIFLKIFS